MDRGWPWRLELSKNSTAVNFIVRAAASRLLAALRISIAFGSSAGVASGAGLASAATGLAFFFGLLCAFGMARRAADASNRDRKSTRLNSSHVAISYAVFCLKKKKK